MAKSLAMEEVHSSLLNFGIANHTLERSPDGTKVIARMFNQGGDAALTAAIEAARGSYGSQVQVIKGRGEFIGTEKQDGSDREQRDDALRAYSEIISSSQGVGGRNVAEIWDRVRNHWQSLQQAGGTGEALRPAAERTSAAQAELAETGQSLESKSDEELSAYIAENSGGVAPAAGTSRESMLRVAKLIQRNKPAAEAKPAAAPAKGEKKKKVEHVSDFAKNDITLANSLVLDKDKQKKFMDLWNTTLDSAPGEFKQTFLGGLPASMRVDYDEDAETLDIKGELHDEEGRPLGTYDRTIDLANKQAKSAFLKLKKSAEGKGIAKKLMKGNMEIYRKLGLEKVKVRANIDVGGYSWARYGYVPTKASWQRELVPYIEKKMAQQGLSAARPGARPVERPRNTYQPESWDMMHEGDHERIFDAWARSTRKEFYNAEVENWRESGGALDTAKSEINGTMYGGEWPEWAQAAIEQWRQGQIEAGREPRFSNEHILDATTLTYESDGEGRNDPDIEFDNTELVFATNFDPDQMTMPGVAPIKPHELLTGNEREGITAALVKAFNDKAAEEAQHVEPPAYVHESVGEYQSEWWSSWGEDSKYDWASQNGELPDYDLPEDEKEEEEPEEQEEPTPEPEPAKTTPERAALMKLVASTDPKAVWKIADSDFGKDLLLDSGWDGVLDMTDPEIMDRFDRYVGNK